MVQNRGINQDVTQEMNRSLLLKNLRREGMCSRAYLASLTGLKQATVTNIMFDRRIHQSGSLPGHRRAPCEKTLQRRPVRFDRDTDHEEAGGF